MLELKYNTHWEKDVTQINSLIFWIFFICSSFDCFSAAFHEYVAQFQICKVKLILAWCDSAFQKWYKIRWFLTHCSGHSLKDQTTRFNPTLPSLTHTHSHTRQSFSIQTTIKQCKVKKCLKYNFNTDLRKILLPPPFLFSCLPLTFLHYFRTERNRPNCENICIFHCN